MAMPLQVTKQHYRHEIADGEAVIGWIESAVART